MEWCVPRGTTLRCAHIAWTGRLRRRRAAGMIGDGESGSGCGKSGRSGGSWDVGDGEILPRNLFSAYHNIFPLTTTFFRLPQRFYVFTSITTFFRLPKSFSHISGTDSISRNLPYFPLTKPILGTDSFFRINSNTICIHSRNNSHFGIRLHYGSNSMAAQDS